MFSLVTKKFKVRKLEIKKGELHLYTDLDGNGNYLMLKREKKKRKNDPLVNLTQLRIEDFKIILNNQVKQLSKWIPEEWPGRSSTQCSDSLDLA